MDSYRIKTLKKARISEEDLKEVENAIADAETKTNGEIACAITSASHNYSFWELLFAVCVGSVVAVILTLCSPFLVQAFEKFFWGDIPSWILTGFIVIVTLISISVAFFIANIPFVDRLFVPKSYRSFAVYRRAMRHFVESGVYDTKEQSGILIFVSLLEREVKIIADRGINQKVPQEKWDAFANKLAQGFSKKTETSSKDALLQTVTECGTLLAENFPPLAENPNELKDAVEILQAGE